MLEDLEEAAGVGPVIVRRHGGLKISPGRVLQERVLEMDGYVPQAVFPGGGGGRGGPRRRIRSTRGRVHQVLEAGISSSRLQSNHLDIGTDIAAAAAAVVVNSNGGT